MLRSYLVLVLPAAGTPSDLGLGFRVEDLGHGQKGFRAHPGPRTGFRVYRLQTDFRTPSLSRHSGRRYLAPKPTGPNIGIVVPERLWYPNPPGTYYIGP